MRTLVLTANGSTTPLKELEHSDMVFLKISDLADPYIRMWFACIWWDVAFVEFGSFDLPKDFYIYLCKCGKLNVIGEEPINPENLAVLVRIFPDKAAKLRKACMLKQDCRLILKEDADESSSL